MTTYQTNPTTHSPQLVAMGGGVVIVGGDNIVWKKGVVAPSESLDQLNAHLNSESERLLRAAEENTVRMTDGRARL